MADHVRGYVHAAYNWGLKCEHDYRSASQRRFRLVYNPAAGIPTEPKNVGTRWLDEDEFVRLYRWLECPDTPVHPPYTRAVRILMLTGQRSKRSRNYTSSSGTRRNASSIGRKPRTASRTQFRVRPSLPS